MMKGHKSELFSLDLSFLGWIILSIIPFVSAYVTPYMQLTYAGFYDSLKRMQYSGEHDYTGYDAPDSDFLCQYLMVKRLGFGRYRTPETSPIAPNRVNMDEPP